MFTPIASFGCLKSHFETLKNYRLKVPLMEKGGKAPTEHEEQRAFIEAWRKCELPRIFAIPNGELRNVRVGMRLKAEGVTPGVPDLYCPELRLWIEFKRQRGGTVSSHQKEWHKYLSDIGDTVVVAKGAHDAVNQIYKFTL
jgi:hypothetical protein